MITVYILSKLFKNNSILNFYLISLFNEFNMECKDKVNLFRYSNILKDQNLILFKFFNNLF